MKTYTYKKLGQNGRLGNQMWQIAWQIGSAARADGQACISRTWDYRSFFSVPDEFFQPAVGEIIDGGELFYQELFHWAEVADKVHAYFQPSDSARAFLKEHYEDWFFDSAVHKTSLHIRAGDYLQHPKSFPVPTDKYYADALSKIPSDSRVVVFSDDLNFAKQKLDKIGIEDAVFIHGIPRPLIGRRARIAPQDQWDMFLMTCCQQHIIANSTFSWWGAYLADSEAVYYPSVWWGPELNARDSRGLDVRDSWVDAIPSEWRKVEC